MCNKSYFVDKCFVKSSKYLTNLGGFFDDDIVDENPSQQLFSIFIRKHRTTIKLSKF